MRRLPDCLGLSLFSDSEACLSPQKHGHILTERVLVTGMRGLSLTQPFIDSVFPMIRQDVKTLRKTGRPMKKWK
jgi:hypothetical protein